MTSARLRVVPAIAHEPEEGRRLRRRSGDAARTTAKAGSGPPRPWSSEICALQMKSKIALILIDALMQDVGAASALVDFPLREHIRIEELAHQIHAIEDAAAALQPN